MIHQFFFFSFSIVSFFFVSKKWNRSFQESESECILSRLIVQPHNSTIIRLAWFLNSHIAATIQYQVNKIVKIKMCKNEAEVVVVCYYQDATSRRLLLKANCQVQKQWISVLQREGCDALLK